MPLYPTEEVIWDENVVPTAYFSGDGCLSLPKLNLQFLTLHDYLLRNFNLFRLESTCEFFFCAAFSLCFVVYVNIVFQMKFDRILKMLSAAFALG